MHLHLLILKYPPFRQRKAGHKLVDVDVVVKRLSQYIPTRIKLQLSNRIILTLK
jgi:hypothetical protein